MPNTVNTLLWDVGGVILSNGWDEEARARAVQRFRYDARDFEARHEALFPALETGNITLSEYLDRALFEVPRPFTKEDFTSFMFAQSTEIAGTRELLDELTASRRYLMGMLNNEGRELNDYRIAKFQLSRNFSLYFCSCYVGARKPDERIYRMALDIMRRPAGECLFIDDRPANLEGAQRLGIRTIRFENSVQLRADLLRNGIRSAPA